MNALFEGSYLGDDSKLDPDSKLECGICWTVYDPAKGDPVWQIPAGTPFADLPDAWRCPSCDAEKHKFMLLDPGAHHDVQFEQEVPRAEELKAALMKAYGAAAARMKGLPIYNEALDVSVLPLRDHAAAKATIVVTPWFMNIVRLDDDTMPGQGEKRMLAFPSGEYEFVGGDLDGVGRIEVCSLFSPMNEFADMASAVEIAEAALMELFTTPEPPQPREVTRREMFRREEPAE